MDPRADAPEPSDESRDASPVVDAEDQGASQSRSDVVEVQRRIDAYRRDLTARPARDIVRRHITGGRCYNLSDDLHFELRRDVATFFKIHPDDVVVVGSAKLGFSIAPDQRYKAFDDGSDIDVALVSAEFFDLIWIEALEFDRSGAEWPDKSQFRKYLFRGWIRPDMFPPSALFPRAKEWTDFFRDLTSSGRFGLYPIRGGLYRTRHFLEAYHLEAVEACIGAEERGK